MMSNQSKSRLTERRNNQENDIYGSEHVTVSELLTKAFSNTKDLYILANIVWSSELPTKKGKKLPDNPKRLRFILADATGHIAATLRLGENPSINAKNICYLLKCGKTVQIKNFALQTIMPPYKPLIRFQKIEILFNYATKDILDVNGDPRFYKYLPMQFTGLRSLDDTNEDLVDIIGFSVQVRRGISTEKCNFDALVLSSSRTGALGQTFSREVTLFGGLGKTVSKNRVYALMNVSVKDSQDGNKLLSSNGNTIIIQLTKDNLFLIPQEYADKSFVQNLIIPDTGVKRKIRTPGCNTSPKCSKSPPMEDAKNRGTNTTYFKLNIDDEDKIKYEVLPKIRFHLIQLLDNAESNKAIISELSTLSFWDPIVTRQLESSQFSSEQDRISGLIGEIEGLDSSDIKICIEKLCNLTNQRKRSERIRKKLEHMFPGSITTENGKE